MSNQRSLFREPTPTTCNQIGTGTSYRSNSSPGRTWMLLNQTCACVVLQRVAWFRSVQRGSAACSVVPPAWYRSVQRSSAACSSSTPDGGKWFVDIELTSGRRQGQCWLLSSGTFCSFAVKSSKIRRIRITTPWLLQYMRVQQQKVNCCNFLV